ncbi:MAG: hypothetical protein Aurels2KO_04820 [Aureliella sp.]
MNEINTMACIANVAFASTLFSASSLLLIVTLRSSSAAMRCRVGVMTIAGLTALPVACFYSPKLSLGWLAMGAEKATVGARDSASDVDRQVFARSKQTAHANSASGLVGGEVLGKQSEPKAAISPSNAQPFSLQGQGQDTSVVVQSDAVALPTVGGDVNNRLLLCLFAVYVAGVLLLVGRLVVELLWAKRVRRRAIAFRRGDKLAGSLRRTGSSQVRVMHADVPVPMVVGVYQPVVLLPCHSEQWSDSQLLSALHHELSHVKRKDLPMQLFCALVRCFYWPQPLVHVLLRRLRWDTELACDQLAVAKSGTSTEYARHLLEIATECIKPPGALSAAMPMFRSGDTRRGDLEARVAAVLSTAAVDRPRRAWLFGAALIFCLLCSVVPSPLQAVTDTPVLSRAPEQLASDGTNPPVTAPEKSESTDDAPQDESDVWRVSGTVVDSRGNPVPDVKIVTGRGDTQIVHAPSNSRGQFELEIPKTDGVHWPHTWFFVEGYGLRSALLPTHRALKDGDALTDVVIPLPPLADPVECKIVAPNGKPLSGAKVRPYAVEWPNGRFMADEPTGIVGPAPEPMSEFLSEQSDAVGKVRLSKVPRALFTSIGVESEEYGLQVFPTFYRDLDTCIELRLEHAVAFTGRILAPEAADVGGTEFRITSRLSSPDNADVLGVAVARLSEAGEFSIAKIPVRHVATLRYDIGWDLHHNFQPTIRKAITRSTEVGYHVEIPTVSTTPVTGVVETKDTNRPLQDVYISFRNPKLRIPATRVKTDANGVYTVKLPAGGVQGQVFAILDPKKPGKYDLTEFEFDVPSGATEFEAPTLSLEPRPSLSGVLYDVSGEPAAGLRICIRDPKVPEYIMGVAETNEDGLFEMPLRLLDPTPESLDRFKWHEIVKPAEGTKPRVLRELEVVERDQNAMVLRRARSAIHQ